MFGQTVDKTTVDSEAQSHLRYFTVGYQLWNHGQRQLSLRQVGLLRLRFSSPLNFAARGHDLEALDYVRVRNPLLMTTTRRF